MQKAAYHLIDEKSRIIKHLEIGRLLLAGTDETELEESIFDIVTHYNISQDLLTDQAEKIQVAKLNLRAGRKSKLSSAFSASSAHLKQSLSLLDDNKWQDHYQLTLDIYNELIEVSYLNIQNQEVKVLFVTMLDNVKQNIDLCIAHKMMIMSKIGENELSEAITLAEGYLDRLHITFDTARNSKLSVDDLYKLPYMKDKEKLAALEILMTITTPIIFSAPGRLPSLIFTMLNIISQYGNSTVSAFAYNWYATYLCLIQQYPEGNIFGQLGVDLLDKYPYPGMATKIMDMQYAWVRHWEFPVHDLIEPLKTYYSIGMQEGDIEWSMYSLLNYTLMLWGTGKPLQFYISEVEPSIEICENHNQEVSLQMFILFAESALNLAGESSNTTQLEGKWFSEDKMMSRLEGNHMVLTLFRLLKMTLYYLFGEPQAAYRHIEEALKFRSSLNPHYLYTKVSFFGGLSCIACLEKTENDPDKEDQLNKLELFEKELKIWAEVAPMNYQHQYDLVIAEKSRVAKKHWKAIQLFEKAIQGAHQNKFVHDEALAGELFGRFWLEQGNDTIAKTYLRKAHALYHLWGAIAKADHLEKCYPQWFQTESIPSGKPDIPDGAGKIRTTITEPVTPIQLDMESIISASQMLSTETDLEQLLTKMISLVMVNSGAEKAVLLLKQDNDWLVQARGISASEKYDVLPNQLFNPADHEANVIPGSVFNYCVRSKDVLILDNAQSDDHFSGDKMIQNQNIQSIACIPVLSHGEIKAMMYLENRHMADIFSLERVKILKHISSQFGISVENALLYDNLSRKISELKESEMKLRSVFENANETITVTQDEAIKYCNPQITELIGYSTAEIRSHRFSEFIHPDDQETVMNEYHERLSGERSRNSYTLRIITKDGQEKFVLVNSALVNWEGSAATLTMITDITQIKKAESDLKRSEERFRQLMEQSPLAMEILMPDGKINIVNSAWRKLWNVSEEEAVEGIDKYNMLTDPQLERLGIMDEVKETFKGKHTILPPIQYNTGQTRDDFNLELLEEYKSPWIQCHLNSVKDAEGNIVFIVNTYVDITDLRKAEEEAIEQRDALARIDRASSMGQLTGSIAHELNQPLTGILSNAQAAELILKSKNHNLEEIKEIFAEIISDTKRAGEVIRNLRALYSEQKVELLPVEINTLVQETVNLLQSEFVVKGINLTTKYDTANPMVKGNKIQIQQVMVNLIMNGIQAMIDMDRKERNLWITTSCDTNEVKVIVTDKGKGINPDIIDNISEPLATWKPDGTGMGLVISNSIIMAHGGRMKAENRPKGGALVYFVIPEFKKVKQ